MKCTTGIIVIKQMRRNNLKEQEIQGYHYAQAKLGNAQS